MSQGSSVLVVLMGGSSGEGREAEGRERFWRRRKRMGREERKEKAPVKK